MRREGVLRHIAVGRPHQGQQVLALVADRDVRVLSERGALLGLSIVDPAQEYRTKQRN